LCINTAEGKFLVIRTKVSKSYQKVNKSYPLLPGFYSPLPPLSKSGLKLVCTVNIVYGNLKSEISQDYAQKPQGNCGNCTFMNSASVLQGMPVPGRPAHG
jgi:hypothetical protein